jgi:hypothetical protein
MPYLYMPGRIRTRRPVMTAIRQALGYISTLPPSRSAPFRCWGPAWDRSCKVCAPLPSGGETCSSFKVNDVQRAPTERLSFVYGRPQ